MSTSSCCDHCGLIDVPQPQEAVHFSLCDVCKSVKYCSFQCRIREALLHNVLCCAYSAFEVTKSRPSTSHKIALLLPSGSESLRFFYLKMTSDNNGGEFPDFETHLGVDRPDSECITYFERHNTAAQSTISIHVRSKRDEDGSEVNEHVKKFGAVDLWRGPMIISLKIDPEVKPSIYKDFNLKYMFRVRCVLASFVSIKNGLMGVVMRCVQRPRVDAVFETGVLKSDEMFSIDGLESRVIPLTKVMGIPLLLSRTLIGGMMTQGHETRRNLYAMFLTIDTDSNSQNWGSIGEDDTGNVLIARVDQKSITAHQVETLVFYCGEVLLPRIQAAISGFGGATDGENMRIKDELMEKWMCQEEFELYFEDLKRRLQLLVPSWAQATSPYAT